MKKFKTILFIAVLSLTSVVGLTAEASAANKPKQIEIVVNNTACVTGGRVVATILDVVPGSDLNPTRWQSGNKTKRIALYSGNGSNVTIAGQVKCKHSGIFGAQYLATVNIQRFIHSGSSTIYI